MPLSLMNLFFEQMYGITPDIRARFKDESLCRRCGRCCHAGLRVNGRMVLIKYLPCRHLKFGPDGLAECRIYSRRGECEWCSAVNYSSLRKEVFPRDCIYMQGLKNYEGKTELSEDEFNEIIHILHAMFSGLECPEYVKKKDWDYFIKGILKIKSHG